MRASLTKKLWAILIILLIALFSCMYYSLKYMSKYTYMPNPNNVSDIYILDHCPTAQKICKCALITAMDTLSANDFQTFKKMWVAENISPQSFKVWLNNHHLDLTVCAN